MGNPLNLGGSSLI